MKTSTPKLAIDFGTSRTKVAYFDEALKGPKLIDMGARQAMPTVFYVPKEGDGEILVGDDAEEMLEEDPEGYVVALKMEIHKPGSKRLGIGRKIDRVELASHLFRHIKAFLEKNEPHFYQSNLDTCTLTVPVDFSDSKRNAIRKAAEMGGFTNIEIIEEPVAAAQAWLAATHQQGIDSVVVCDIGGGTTDYAVVKYRHGIFQPVPEIPTKGMEWGGDRLDEMIIDHVQDEDEEAETEEKQGFWSRIGKWKGAFKSKVRLIKERQAKRPKDIYEPRVQDTKLSVSKEVIQRCTDEFTDQVCEELQGYLEQCREKLGVESIPILLVGGSSKLPGLEEKIKAFAGETNVFHWTYSDYAIVLGATYNITEIGNDANQTEQVREQESEAVENPEKKEEVLGNLQQQIQTVASTKAMELGANVPANDEAKKYYDAARRYENGDGCPQDSEEAAKNLRLAAEAGHAESQNRLGFYYSDGFGVKKDEKIAAQWYGKAVAQGYVEAQAALGSAYVFGFGVEKDIQKGLGLIQKSVEQEDADGLTTWAMLLAGGELVQPDAEKAAKLLDQAIKKEGEQVGLALYLLAILYQTGQGVGQNADKATELFNKAAKNLTVNAKKGFCTRQHFLGLCLVQLDKTFEAVEWFRKSAEQDYPDAQTQLGHAYLNGVGVSENHAEAVKWFRKAAEQDEPEAQNMLGICYLNGTGVSQNNNQAFQWCLKAAKQELPIAMFNVGFFYNEGIGIQKNSKESQMWLDLAAQQGCQEAIDYLNQKKKAGIMGFLKNKINGRPKTATIVGAVAGTVLLGPLGGVAGGYLGRAIGSTFSGSDPGQTDNAKIEPRSEDGKHGKCPKCGFDYGWNGSSCRHCRHGL